MAKLNKTVKTTINQYSTIKTHAANFRSTLFSTNSNVALNAVELREKMSQKSPRETPPTPRRSTANFASISAWHIKNSKDVPALEKQQRRTYSSSFQAGPLSVAPGRTLGGLQVRVPFWLDFFFDLRFIVSYPI